MLYPNSLERAVEVAFQSTWHLHTHVRRHWQLRSEDPYFRANSDTGTGKRYPNDSVTCYILLISAPYSGIIYFDIWNFRGREASKLDDDMSQSSDTPYNSQ